MVQGDRIKAGEKTLEFNVFSTISSYDFLSHPSFSINLNAAWCCEYTLCFPASCLCSYFPLHIECTFPISACENAIHVVLL